MAEMPHASTFIVRLVHDPSGGVSGVVERVRTGVKEKFEGREALCRLIQQMLLREADEA
jgi:hypothetical protein